MADVKVASTSIKEVKQEITALRGEMVTLTKGTEEYAKKQQEVNALQGKLNEVMKDTNGRAQGVSGSLAEMSQKLSQMTKDLRENYTYGTKAWEEQRAKVRALRDEVANAEQSYGSYGRNVGNYAESFKSAFTEMGATATNTFKAMLTGQMSVKAGMAALTTGIKTMGKAFLTNPIGLAIGAIVTAFLALKKSIQGNEEASQKWSKAMAAFQPVLNVIKRLLGYLGEALADVALWLAEKTPKALGFVGKALGFGIRVVEQFINTWFLVPKGVGYVLDFVVKGVSKAVGAIAQGIAKVTDLLGMDEITAKLNAFGDVAKNFTIGAGDAITKFAKGITGSIENAAKAVENFGQRSGQAVQNSINRQEELNAIERDRRTVEVETAKSELKQQELLREAYTKTGEERKKLLQQYEAEVNKTAEAQKNLAAREYKIAKQLADLNPTDKATKDRLANLEANVYRVEKSAESAKKRSTRMITSLDQQASKEAAALTKKEIAEFEKKEKEKEKIAKETYAKIKADAGAVGTESGAEENRLKEEMNLLKEQNALTLEMEQEFQTKMFKVKQDSLDEQIEIYRQASENETLLDSQRQEALMKINELTLRSVVESTKYQVEIEKLKAQELKTTYDSELQDISNRETEALNAENERYSTELQALTDRLTSGQIKYSEYETAVETLEKEHQERLTELGSIGAQERLDAEFQNWQNTVSLYGEQSEISLNSCGTRYVSKSYVEDTIDFMEKALSEIKVLD